MGSTISSELLIAVQRMEEKQTAEKDSNTTQPSSIIGVATQPVHLRNRDDLSHLDVP